MSRPMKKTFAEYDAAFDAKLAELEAEKRTTLLDWDYVAAPFLERPMVIYPDQDPVEVEYARVQDFINEKYMVPFEGFLEGEKAYHETVREAEKLVADVKARAAAGEVVDMEKERNEIYIKFAGSETGDRIIEQYELLTHVDNPRRTQADHDDDRRSLNRKLDEPCVRLRVAPTRTAHLQAPRGCKPCTIPPPNNCRFFFSSSRRW